MILFNAARSNQPSENAFCQSLCAGLAGVQLIQQTRKLSDYEFTNPFVDIRRIEALLSEDEFIPHRKMSSFLGELKLLPDRVQVASASNRISVDFHFQHESGEQFPIEFHEAQHRSLSVSRTSFIYRQSGEKVPVPRKVQRFLRDVWRIEILKNFRIVWVDWYQQHPDVCEKTLFDSGQVEFHLSHKFSFSRFLKIS